MDMPDTSRERAAEPGARADDAAREAGRAVLELAQKLCADLHTMRGERRLTLEDRIDADLGLDSLGRMELLQQIERRLSVRLPDALLAEAETLRDLAEGALAARASPGASVPRIVAPDLALGPVDTLPLRAGTLLDVFAWHLDAHPDRTHLLLEGEGDQELLSYRSLWERAGRVAAGLRARDVAPGAGVAIMLPTSSAFFATFLGVLRAGAIPVPIYPPLRPAQLEDHLRRQVTILENAEVAAMVTSEDARRAASLLRAQRGALRVEVAEALERTPGTPPAPSAKPDDVALLQYTSGSTGAPKGVVLSHANLLANVRAMGRALAAGPEDVFVSWLPLYHDMGLIGAWLGSLYHAVPAVIFSPLRFLSRPERWLWAIHHHRGTLSAAPNFAYEICASRISEADLEGLDLSSWRCALNGAEAVSAATLRRFTARFAPYGFRSEALMPVYGLAESAVGLAFPPLGRGPRIDRVSRTALTARGEARPAGPEDGDALEVPSCGLPLMGHAVRVVDPAGRELPERWQGRLELRGPSATRGYFHNEAATRALIRGEWLDSGDLAYMAEGEVYLTGRVKDLIIRAGRNIHPQEIEEQVGSVRGVRKGCVAVFGSADPEHGTERVIVLAETRETDPDRRERLRSEVERVATSLLEGPPDDVVMAPPHAVLKTSSGKIRRAACRALYEQGKIGERARAVWWQIMRLQVAGIRARAGRAARRALTLGYGALWWLLLVVIALFVWPLVVFLPRRSAKRAALRAGARSLLALTGTRLRVENVDRLRRGQPAVVVVNHASYADGLVLAAALPSGARFVAKRELDSQRVAGPFLRALDTLFVERTELEQSLEDARSIAAAVHSSPPVLFFPEGTFHREAGLRPFHLGAFLAAAQAGVPLVPAVIRGTRAMLRGGQWLPSRGHVALELGEPMHAPSADFAGAIALRDAARAWMLARCGEPDLEE